MSERTAGKVAFMVSRPEDSGIILGNPDDDRAASLLGGGDMLYKSPKGVMRLQGLFLGSKADFQEYLDRAMDTDTNADCWNSGLDFSSFAAENKNVISDNNKNLQTRLNQSNEFSFNITLDDITKSQIISLYRRGYELYQIVQEVFQLSRTDGRKYKRIRDIVAEFINSLKEGQDDDT